MAYVSIGDQTSEMKNNRARMRVRPFSCLPWRESQGNGRPGPLHFIPSTREVPLTFHVLRQGLLNEILKVVHGGGAR